jgi:hypothetical protein
MADGTKTSLLTETTAIADGDLFMVVQGGINKKITTENTKNSLTGNVLTLAWDGMIFFSDFYLAKNLVAITYPVTISLLGAGHIIDDKGSAYNNLDYIYFDSGEIQKEITIEDGVTFSELPHLLRNVTLSSTSSAFICSNPSNSNGWYLGKNCVFQCLYQSGYDVKGLQISSDVFKIVLDNGIIRGDQPNLEVISLVNATVSFTLNNNLNLIFIDPTVFYGDITSSLAFTSTVNYTLIDSINYTNFLGTISNAYLPDPVHVPIGGHSLGALPIADSVGNFTDGTLQEGGGINISIDPTSGVPTISASNESKELPPVMLATFDVYPLTGVQVIDGVTTTDNERVYIGTQPDMVDTGIYITNSTGAWTRSTDMPIGKDVAGYAFRVMIGDAYGNSIFANNSIVPVIVGTDPVLFIAITSTNLAAIEDVFTVPTDGENNYVLSQPPYSNVNFELFRNGQLRLKNVDYKQINTNLTWLEPGGEILKAGEQLIARYNKLAALAPAVTTVFGRVGDIIAIPGDYTDAQVLNSSTVSGIYVDDALNTLDSGKENIFSKGSLTSSTTGVTIAGGINAVIGSGTTITIGSATTAIQGLVQLITLDGTSETLAATQKAVTDVKRRTKSIFIPAETSGNYGTTYRSRSIAGSGNFNFIFQIPLDFIALVDAHLMCFPSAGASGTGKDIDLTTAYCNELLDAYNLYGGSDPTNTFDITGYANKRFQIRFTALLGSVVAGSLGGVNVTHNAIGGAIDYIGIVIKYT